MGSEEELKKLSGNYGIVFLGSDQIWNPILTKGLDSVYFGSFLDSNTVRASYAASIGVAKFNEKNKEKIKQEIAGLDYIGVREKSAKEVIDNLCKKK